MAEQLLFVVDRVIHVAGNVITVLLMLMMIGLELLLVLMLILY